MKDDDDFPKAVEAMKLAMIEALEPYLVPVLKVLNKSIHGCVRLLRRCNHGKS